MQHARHGLAAGGVEVAASTVIRHGLVARFAALVVPWAWAGVPHAAGWCSGGQVVALEALRGPWAPQ